MEMEDYKPNSFKYREAVRNGNGAIPEPKEVVKGGTSVKKTTGKRIKGELVKADAKDVFDYIIFDIAIPAGKKLLSEALTTSLDMFLGLDTRRRRDNGSRVSYTRFYDERRDDRRDYRNPDRRSGGPVRRDVYDYEFVTFDYEGDAIAVRNELAREINEYGSTTVNRFYTMAKQPTMSTDYNYGWTTLRSAEVYRNADGTYSIDFPRAIPL